MDEEVSEAVPVGVPVDPPPVDPAKLMPRDSGIALLPVSLVGSSDENLMSGERALLALLLPPTLLLVVLLLLLVVVVRLLVLLLLPLLLDAAAESLAAATAAAGLLKDCGVGGGC